MADQKITELTADATPTSTDLLLTVDDPSGIPVNKKATIADVVATVVSAWARGGEKPAYTNAEVGAAAAVHGHVESDVTNLATDLAAKIPKSLMTAKGSIIVASGVDTPAEIVVGTDGKVLTAQADGTVAWETPAAGGGTGDVVGPPSATGDHVAVFDSTTGKLIKDGGTFVTGTWFELDVNGDLEPVA